MMQPEAGRTLLSASVQEVFDMLEKLPPNKWVAVCEDEARVLAMADTWEEVIDEAEAKHEGKFIVTRVPDPTMTWA